MWLVEGVVTEVLSKLVRPARNTSREAQASPNGGPDTFNLTGLNQYGEPNHGSQSRHIYVGGGAYVHRDGLSPQGHRHIPAIRLQNIERAKNNTPLLYLSQIPLRHRGAGPPSRRRFSAGHGYILHRSREDGRPVSCHCYELPTSPGLFGGYPSACNTRKLRKNANVRAQIEAGHLPEDMNAIGGELQILSGQDDRGRTEFTKNDVYESGPRRRRLGRPDRARHGAGDRGRRDFNLVSLEVARDIYGVVLDAEGRADEPPKRAAPRSAPNASPGRSRAGSKSAGQGCAGHNWFAWRRSRVDRSDRRAPPISVANAASASRPRTKTGNFIARQSTRPRPISARASGSMPSSSQSLCLPGLRPAARRRDQTQKRRAAVRYRIAALRKVRDLCRKHISSAAAAMGAATSIVAGSSSRAARTISAATSPTQGPPQPAGHRDGARNLGVIEHRQDVTRRLAKAGYAPLPSISTAASAAGRARFQHARERRLQGFPAMPDEQVIPDLKPAGASGGTSRSRRTRIGAIGYCSGGGCSTPGFGEQQQSDMRGRVLRIDRPCRPPPVPTKAVRPHHARLRLQCPIQFIRARPTGCRSARARWPRRSRRPGSPWNSTSIPARTTPITMTPTRPITPRLQRELGTHAGIPCAPSCSRHRGFRAAGDAGRLNNK